MKAKQSAEPKYEFIQPRDGIHNIYANHVNAMWTAHDVRITFGELVKLTESVSKSPRVFTVEDRVAVTMAWTEAKLMNNMLSEILASFESKNGEIKLPVVP